MITTIRNKLQGTGFRIVMGVLLLLIAIVWVMPPAPQMKREFFGDWIIDINGNKVSYQEFRRKYASVDHQLQLIKQQYGQYAEAFLRSQGISSDPKDIVLDEITRDALLNYAATQVPLDISPEFVKEKLKDAMFLRSSGLAQLLPPELLSKDGSIDSAMLAMYLKRIGMSASQFEEALERALERIMVSELVAMGVHVPEFQLKDALKNRYARKKFSILTWSIDDLIRKEKESPLSDDELQKFYTQQSSQLQRYWVPEKRAGNVWEFNADAYGIDVSSKEVEQYYERNKSSFIEKPMQIHARRILIAVQSDESEQDRYNRAKEIELELKDDPAQFARLAKEHSDDTKTASNGGLMEPFSKGDHERDFEVAVFTLKNDGDVSGIFKSKNGFEIVQRVKRVPVQYKPFTSVQKDIHTKLANDAFKRKFIADVARLGKKPSAERLEEFVKVHNMMQKTSIEPSADTGSAEVHALFTLRDGEVTSVVDQGRGMIVQLTEIQKKHLPALDQIKEKVEQDMYQSRAYETLQKQMKQAKGDLKAESLQDVKRKYGISLQETSWIDFAEKPEVVAKELQRYKVPAGYFSDLGRVGSVLEYEDDSRGYLIRLSEVEPVSEGDLGSQKIAELKLQLHKEKIRPTLDSFVDSLRGNAKIERNEQIISKLKDRAS